MVGNVGIIKKEALGENEVFGMSLKGQMTYFIAEMNKVLENAFV